MSLHPIATVDAANNISLHEFRVGKAYQSIVYPGIRQCFAVVGQRQSFIIGTHVSPGAHADGVADSFAFMRDLGGNWVTNWYVVGPFGDHFSSGDSTAWKSATDIRASFTEHFGGASADHYVLDVTILRHMQHKEDLGQGPTNVSTDYLDIKAELNAASNTVDISYRTSHRDGRNQRINSAWKGFNPWYFKRF